MGDRVGDSFSSIVRGSRDIAIGTAAGIAGFSLITAGGIAAGRAISDGLKLASGAVFGMNAQLETSTLQFKTLTGSADFATQHVASLFRIAKETPFETGPIIEASLALENFGGAALNNEKNVRLIGDAAAATNTPIQELAFWVGRAYSAIAAGRPFGEAAMRLQELKVLTPQARTEMEKLEKTGGSTTEVWDILVGSLERYEGAMKEQAGTWAGLVSTFTDSANILVSHAFRPLFEEAKNTLGRINEFLDSAEAERWAARMEAAVKDVIAAFGGAPNSMDPLRDALEAMPRLIAEGAKALEDLKLALDKVGRSPGAAVLGALFGLPTVTLPEALYGQMNEPTTPRGASASQRLQIEETLGPQADRYRQMQQELFPPPEVDRTPPAMVPTFGDPEKDAERARQAADRAARDAERAAQDAIRQQEAAFREAQRIAQEFHRTKPITADLFEGAFVREDPGAGMGAGRGAFEAMRRVIEEGGQSNIDAVGRMAADMRERMFRELGPEQGADWFGAFMDAVNVAIVTQSVDAAHNVGALVQNFDIERQLQDAGKKSADAINAAIQDTEAALIESGARLQERIADTFSRAGPELADSVRTMMEGIDLPDELRQKVLDELDFSVDIKERMDAAQDALRDGLERMRDTQQRIADAITGGRGARATQIGYGREDLLTKEERERERQRIEDTFQRRQTDIRRRGGTGVGEALSEAGRQYAQEIAALDERTKLEDANRQRRRQWAAEDQAQRMADALADKERQVQNQVALEAERKRLELPIQTLQIEVQRHALERDMAKLYSDQANEAERLLAALTKITTEQQRQREQKATDLGRPGHFGESITPSPDRDEIDFIPVEFDGERVSTLVARRHVNRVSTTVGVSGGA